MSELFVSMFVGGSIVDLYQLDVTELTFDVQSLKAHHFPEKAVKVGIVVESEFIELPEKAKFIPGKKYVVVLSGRDEGSNKALTGGEAEFQSLDTLNGSASSIGTELQSLAGSVEHQNSSSQMSHRSASLPNDNFGQIGSQLSMPSMVKEEDYKEEQSMPSPMEVSLSTPNSRTSNENLVEMELDVMNKAGGMEMPQTHLVVAIGASNAFPDAKWQSVNLVELLNSDQKTKRIATELVKGTNVTADHSLRVLMVKKMGHYLMANSVKPNNPSRSEIRAFLQHCLAPYGLSSEPYCGANTRGYLGEFVHNQRRNLKGITPFRPYKKKTGLVAASDDDKANNATLKELPPQTGAWSTLLDKTFDYRIACMSNPSFGLSSCYLEFPFLFVDASVILSDFCKKFKKPVEELSVAWEKFSMEIRKYCTANLKEEAELACGLNDLSEPGKYSYDSVLMAFAALQKISKRKVSRVKYLFNSYAEETDVEACIAKLKKDGLTQPSILKVGLRGQLYIVLEGRPIRVDGAFSTAIFACFAFFSMFDLKYPPQISDFWQVIEPLAGVSNSKCMNGAKILIEGLSIGISAEAST